MKLSDLCNVYSGYALKNFNSNGIGVPVIKIGNINSVGNLDLNNCQYTTDEVNEKYFSKYGDIYVALSGATTGKTGIMVSNEKYIINQRVGIIRCIDTISYEFIKYFLIYKTDEILAEASGCAQPNISPKQIAVYEVPNYSIEKMCVIANKLNRIKSIINKRQQELDKLDELVKARFVEMFGDVVSNTKNWKTYTWNDVLVIKNGKNQKNVENNKGIYPICGSGGIMSYADDYITESNSVIIGRKGNINNPILMREKFWNVDTAFGLEPNTTILNVDYLFMFCSFFDFEVLNKAVTIPSLTKADLLKIIIPIPPIKLQNQFATFVKQIDKSKVAVQKALDEAQLLFDSLMQEYFG